MMIAPLPCHSHAWLSSPLDEPYINVINLDKNKSDPGKYDIFICYRRDGGETIAMLIHDRLVAMATVCFLT
jgi:ureidoglycolate hydrolase